MARSRVGVTERSVWEDPSFPVSSAAFSRLDAELLPDKKSRKQTGSKVQLREEDQWERGSLERRSGCRAAAGI